jgi:tRNA threonylcarbamoyladenosine biosynthesis protein TsaE
MTVERWIASPEALGALGARLSRSLAVGDAVCLWGPLGAGKSTLARGLIRALTRPDEEAPSPTFTLVQTYDGPQFPVAHFDLYRLTRPEDLDELGLEDALERFLRTDSM